MRVGFRHRAGCFSTPEGHWFRLRAVEVSDEWKDLRLRDGALYSTGGAELRRWLDRQLSPRSGSMSSSQSAIIGWGFHTVPGGIDPGDHFCRPRVVGAADGWKHD